MTDETARVARLMRVIDDMTKELDRQGIAEAMAELGFDPVALAEVVIKAADGDVIQFPGPRYRPPPSRTQPVMMSKAALITRSIASRWSIMPWRP
jgi:hypothetical protein